MLQTVLSISPCWFKGNEIYPELVIFIFPGGAKANGSPRNRGAPFGVRLGEAPSIRAQVAASAMGRRVTSRSWALSFSDVTCLLCPSWWVSFAGLWGGYPTTSAILVGISPLYGGLVFGKPFLLYHRFVASISHSPVLGSRPSGSQEAS